MPGVSPVAAGGSPYMSGGSPPVLGGGPQLSAGSTVTATATPLMTDITAGATPAPFIPVNIDAKSEENPASPQPIVSLS